MHDAPAEGVAEKENLDQKPAAGGGAAGVNVRKFQLAAKCHLAAKGSERPAQVG